MQGTACGYTRSLRHPQVCQESPIKALFWTNVIAWYVASAGGVVVPNPDQHETSDEMGHDHEHAEEVQFEIPQDAARWSERASARYPCNGPMMNNLVRQSLAEQQLDAGSDFVLAEWSAAPSMSEDGKSERMAPIHVHRRDDEAWYVLEGALGFSFDGDEFSVPAGGAALAKAGVAHTYWNAASTTTRYLIITTPKIREMIAVLHDPERQQGRSMEDIFAAYDTVLVPQT